MTGSSIHSTISLLWAPRRTVPPRLLQTLLRVSLRSHPRTYS
jgi:hypothetical protein